MYCYHLLVIIFFSVHSLYKPVFFWGLYTSDSVLIYWSSDVGYCSVLFALSRDVGPKPNAESRMWILSTLLIFCGRLFFRWICTLLVLTCWALLSTLVRPEELPSEDYRSGYETLVVKVAMQLWGLITVYLVLSFFYGFPKLGPKFRIHRYQYFIIVSIMIVLLPFARHNLFFQSIPLYKPGIFWVYILLTQF